MCMYNVYIYIYICGMRAPALVPAPAGRRLPWRRPFAEDSRYVSNFMYV